ncbi:MAG: type II toxin-antitoxin system RelE family toxin [Roseibacillus sp.]
MLQIVFNEISAAEISQLDTLAQLQIFDEFQVSPQDLENLDGEKFGKLDRDGKSLYRFRSDDWRFYFEVADNKVIVHRVLHKGSLTDFLYRSKISSEDEALADSKHFWNLIDEGRNAKVQG